MLFGSPREPMASREEVLAARAGEGTRRGDRGLGSVTSAICLWGTTEGRPSHGPEGRSAGPLGGRVPQTVPSSMLIVGTQTNSPSASFPITLLPCSPPRRPHAPHSDLLILSPWGPAQLLSVPVLTCPRPENSVLLTGSQSQRPSLSAHTASSLHRHTRGGMWDSPSSCLQKPSSFLARPAFPSTSHPPIC